MLSVLLVIATLQAPAAISQSDARSREQLVNERNEPKDYHAELKAALARFVSRDGTVLSTLSSTPLGFQIRENAKVPHPVHYMWLEEMVHETITRPNGVTVTSSRGRPRGIAVISLIEGRMTVESFFSEAEIRARPRRVYELLPSRLCPQVLGRFDIRGELHTPDKEELDAREASDARLLELLQPMRANAQEVALVPMDDHTQPDANAIQPFRGKFGFRFGGELPALTDEETQVVASILRSPSSYVEGMSGCMFSPVIALKFPSRGKLTVLVCFQCRQLLFMRGTKQLFNNDLTEPAAQMLLDTVRRVMPSLPDRLPR